LSTQILKKIILIQLH